MDGCDWIAVDWGTSNLRAFAMQGQAVLAEAASAEGMGCLAPEGFEAALLRLIGDWLDDDRVLPVLACGMVGARQGWVEAPYRAVPCAPVAKGEAMVVATRDTRIRVSIVPGLSQAAPPDVMRGEETQIAGFLAAEPGFEGLLILPGTHSKHVRVASGRVLGFSTFMTGELFALLSRQSVLRLSLGGSGEGRTESCAAAFAAGVAEGAEGGALAALFGIRAEALLGGAGPQDLGARLSGLLIGAELAGIAPGAAVVVIGAGGLSENYVEALGLMGHRARAEDGGALVRQGLALLRG